jgi:flagellum-specific ATP synthase
LSSISRLANKVTTPEEVQAAQRVREALSLYQQSSDLIQLGAHVQGANPKLDQSIRMRPQIIDYLRQGADTFSPLNETRDGLFTLAKQLP